MIITLPSLEQIEQRVRARLEGGKLRNLGPGSVVMTLIRAVIAELTDPGGIWEQLDAATRAAHLGTAEGEALDGCGTFFGELGRRKEGEDDAEYRYRLSRVVASQEPAGLESIEAEVKKIEGIGDVASREYVFGPGSFAMAYTGNVDPAVVDQAVRKWIAPGTYYRIYPARNLNIGLTLALRFAARASVADREAASLAAEQAVRKYVMTLDLGSTVSIDMVRRRAIESHEAIVECRVTEVTVDGVPAPVQDILVPWDSVPVINNLTVRIDL